MPAHIAARLGKTDACMALVDLAREEGAVVEDLVDHTGKNLLHVAALAGMAEVVATLLDAGFEARVEDMDIERSTALVSA